MGNKTSIGKDVIESLTLSMYEDSKFIYREYIQNSADQIDIAVSLGFLSKRTEGYIEIEIDLKKRRIIIEDNGTGIKGSEVETTLKNIAQSNKKRGIDKGFRGIGRLGGLGYCERLIFETSYKGEPEKTILIWDAKLFKSIINNRSLKEEASEVIDRITTVKIGQEEEGKHYFKVILEDVSNESLLDKKLIREYLSMVAPVPFHPRFTFVSEIRNSIEVQKINIEEYRVFVNSEELFKAYTSKIYDDSQKTIDEVIDIKTFTTYSREKILTWGWYGISTFNGVIPEFNIARGLRLRKNNIQIGNEDTLVRLHKQKRNNFYFFGEIHALSPDLLPNARRDYFSENEDYYLFEQELRKFFDSELKRLFHVASDLRNANKAIENLEKSKRIYEEHSVKGFNNKEQKANLELEFEQRKRKAEEAKSKIENITEKYKNFDTPIDKIASRIINSKSLAVDKIKLKGENKDLVYRTDKLSRLTKSERKLITRVFEVIDKVVSKDLAENLKLKIEEEFK